MNNRNETRKLTFEQFEKREVMAGNVQAAIYGDQLVLVGDGGSNSLEVAEVGYNYVKVQGTNGTLVNGKNAAAYFYNPSDKVNAYLNGGDDILSFGSIYGRQTNFDSVYADLGDGSDVCCFWGTTVYNNSTVIMGSQTQYDTDTFDMGRNPFAGTNSYGSAFLGNLNLQMGAGNDFAAFRDSSIVYRSLWLDMGKGNDKVDITQLKVDNFFAKLGEGDDKIYAWGLAAAYSEIDGGYGVDDYFGPTDFKYTRIKYGFERVNVY